MTEPTEPTDAWETGERRRTRTIGYLVGAVAFLAFGVLSLAGLAVDQRERLTTVSQQNDELVDLLNGRTPIIEHIDQAVTRVECLIEKHATVLILIVIAVVDDNPKAVEAVLDANDDLMAALDGICRDTGDN